MKTIRQIFEENNPVDKDDSGYSYISADYEDAFTDCKILLWETVGEYQGDHVVLVKGPDKKPGVFIKGNA